MRKYDNVDNGGLIALEDIFEVIKFQGGIDIKGNGPDGPQQVGNYVKFEIFVGITVDFLVFGHKVVKSLLKLKEVVQKQVGTNFTIEQLE